MEKTEIIVTSTVKKMDALYGKIGNGYLQFAGLVGLCREKKQAEEAGYKNVYDLCKERYNMSRGTVGNLCKIYEHFCDHETGKLLPEFADRKLTELLRALPERQKPEEETKETESTTKEDEVKENIEESAAEKNEPVNYSLFNAIDEAVADAVAHFNAKPFSVLVSFEETGKKCYTVENTETGESVILSLE